MSVVTGTGMILIVDIIVTGAEPPTSLVALCTSLLLGTFPPLMPVPVPAGPLDVEFPAGKGAVPIGAPDG